jgi:MoaA/NifB/PqqE/SkfB family radical SAM enzyme
LFCFVLFCFVLFCFVLFFLITELFYLCMADCKHCSFWYSTSPEPHSVGKYAVPYFLAYVLLRVEIDWFVRLSRVL